MADEMLSGIAMIDLEKVEDLLTQGTKSPYSTYTPAEVQSMLKAVQDAKKLRMAVREFLDADVSLSVLISSSHDEGGASGQEVRTADKKRDRTIGLLRIALGD